jgi:hypothetical protein
MKRLVPIIIVLLIGCGHAAAQGTLPTSPNPCDQYKMRIVKPNPNVDYKLIINVPNTTVDYKIRIINPCQITPTLAVSGLENDLDKARQFYKQMYPQLLTPTPKDPATSPIRVPDPPGQIQKP